MYKNGTTQPILLDVANTLLPLCTTLQPSSSSNSNYNKTLGIALGIIFGVLILLGVWRWFYLQNQKKKTIQNSVELKTSGNPMIHRIGIDV